MNEPTTSTHPRTLPFDRPGLWQPPPQYAELRADAPVAPVITPDGQRAWLVTSYDAVATVLSDPRFGMAPPGSGPTGEHTLFQDGEAHARLRRLVSRSFAPKNIAALRPGIEKLATRLVDGLTAAGPPADLVAELAAPLPLRVISDLLGVEPDDRERFAALADAAGSADFSAADQDEGLEAAARAWHELTGYAASLVAARRRRPGDDLLSGLISVRDTDDGRLSDAELIAMVATLVAAGYVSTRNAIAVGVIQLIGEDHLGVLCRDPSRTEAVVEEVLRRQAGLTAEPFPRWAQQDVALAGTSVRAGDLLLVRLEAAHRDPGPFPQPDRFVPDRFMPDRFRSGQQPVAPHLAFGRGPHHCLGAALARVELAAVFGALARRLPRLRLQVPVEDVVWAGGQTDTGPTAVPVTW
ncbi:cytochrome P450 [Streptomyces bluensis]|uniref:cytochrome P450 n=1 Tax=Streptomyces bluensis TaxID=33897 RepID=UPI0033271E28